MANEKIKYLSVANLEKFKELYDAGMSTELAKSIKTVAVNQTGTKIQFYREEEPVGSATPAFEVEFPDVSGFISKIAGATGGKVAITKADGTIEEGTVASNDIATKTEVGSVPGTATATTVVGYAEEVAASKAADAVSGVSGSAVIASKSGNVVTLKAGVSQSAAVVSNNSDSDITLAEVASTGAAEDVSYDNTTSGLTATDVQGAIDEVAEASAGGVSSKTVYMVDNGATSVYAKVYSVYQGSTGSSSSPVAGEKIGEINIPKDKVVESGSVVTVTFNSEDGKLYDGATDVTELIKGAGGTASANDAGKYIKLGLQNVTDPLYIFVKDLVDIYTAQQNAAQIQITIDGNNVISAEIVDGSVDTDALGTSAVTTAKIADSNVTTAKIADANVTADKLATDSVVTAKIADANVTKAKLATAVQNSLNLADSALQSSNFETATDADIEALFSSNDGE